MLRNGHRAVAHMSEDDIRWSALAAADPALIARLPHPRAYYELGRALHRSDIAAERDAAIFALNTAHSPAIGSSLHRAGSRCRLSRPEAEHALRKAVKFLASPSPTLASAH